jgi:hypothetical protein
MDSPGGGGVLVFPKHFAVRRFQFARVDCRIHPRYISGSMAQQVLHNSKVAEWHDKEINRGNKVFITFILLIINIITNMKLFLFLPKEFFYRLFALFPPLPRQFVRVFMSLELITACASRDTVSRLRQYPSLQLRTYPLEKGDPLRLAARCRGGTSFSLWGSYDTNKKTALLVGFPPRQVYCSKNVLQMQAVHTYK